MSPMLWLLLLPIVIAAVLLLSIRGPHPQREEPEQPVVWLPRRTMRTCCGTISDQPHQPRCTWAPGPPSPAQWSDR